MRGRANLIRSEIVRMLYEAGGGHFGGSFSCIEILVALYSKIMRVDPKDPRWPERDRFVLSKGHACAALCPVLAEAGYFEKELLKTFNKFNSPFGMHPDMNKIPGCDMSTGSLGHGLPVGVGMSLAARLDGKGYRVFVLLGDGECSEGSVWEAALSASHYGLDNLVAIVDRNRISLDGETETIMRLEPLASKWAAFGWSVKEIDGHNLREIVDVLSRVPATKGKPTAVIANTVKGKGVSFMENTRDWHYAALNEDQLYKALKELEAGHDDGR